MTKSIAAPSALALFVGTFLLLAPAFAGAEDLSCIHRAIDDRAQRLRDANNHFASDADSVTNRLTDSEHSAIGSSDATNRYNAVANAFQNFSSDTNNVWNRLIYDQRSAWDTYYRSISVCQGGSFAPGGYGGGYSSYGYDNHYSNNGYGNGYSNYGYGNSYSSHSSCPQLALPAPPADCTYSCTRDPNGCQSCRLACSGTNGYPACGCPATYLPVCGHDNHTYDNACLAICTAGSVWHMGTCR